MRNDGVVNFFHRRFLHFHVRDRHANVLSKMNKASRTQLSRGLPMKVFSLADLSLALILAPALPGLTPLLAQLPPPAQSNQLAQILAEFDALQVRVESIDISTQYCKPPHQPNKSEPQFDIDLERLSLKLLSQRFHNVEKSYVAAGNSRMGQSYRATFPDIDGYKPDDRNYWPRAKSRLTQIQNVLDRKQKRLDAAPERDCAAQQAKQQAPKDPEPPPDPLAGLKRPVPRDINIPMVPHYFCSELERRQWYLKNFAPDYEKAGENAADASEYRAAVSRRGASQFNKGSDPAQQKRLDAEERWADKNSAQHQHMARVTDSIRQVIMNTPIINCSLLQERFAQDAAIFSKNIEGFQNQIKQADSEIEQKEKLISETNVRINQIEGAFYQSFEGGIFQSQELEDLAREEDRLRQHRHDLARDRDRLVNERMGLQGELERTVQLRDSVLKADARTAGTPKPSAEEAQVEDKRPGLFESLIPSLIPSIGIGRGRDRGRGHPNPCAGR